MSADVTVRAATPRELSDVLGVLDAAALETDADGTRDAIDRGDVLVAVPTVEPPERGTCEDDPVVVGALVLEGAEIAAVGVRRRRRGQGIGTALVAAAADRRDRLTAEFDGSVRPFYEEVGFTVESVGDGRYRGRLATGDDVP